MADLGSALRARLIADAAVAAMVGTRVYWGAVPATAAMPYLVLFNIGGPRDLNLSGASDRRRQRVQADCVADRHMAATELAELLLPALEGPATYSGVKLIRTEAGEPRDLGGDVPGVGFVHRASVDLLVDYRIV